MGLAKLSRLVLRGEQPRERDSAPAATVSRSLPLQGANSQQLGTRRFAFVDSLRGIAALSVAAYHIDRYGPLPGAASSVIPKFINSTLHHGWVGVQMFFVISGFVIAYTLRGMRVTPSSLGNFALRRSLRLDPPYWVTMLFVVGLYVLTTSLFNVEDGLMDQAPTWDQVLAHLCYMQNILGYHNLSAGFWTLCIEVQFYILFAVLLGFAQRLTAHCSERAKGGALAAAAADIRSAGDRVAVLVQPGSRQHRLGRSFLRVFLLRRHDLVDARGADAEVGILGLRRCDPVASMDPWYVRHVGRAGDRTGDLCRHRLGSIRSLAALAMAPALGIDFVFALLDSLSRELDHYHARS